MSGGSSNGNSNTTQPVYAGVQIQTSVYGKPVALVYGTNRLAANLIWYNDFNAIANTSSSSSGGGGKGGGGGGGSTSTSYTYTCAVALGLCAGTIAGIGQVWVDKVVTTTSALGLSLYSGTIGQTAPSYIASNHPDQAVGYAGTAYLFTGTYQLGSSASLPNHSFEVVGQFATGPNGDAMPATILADYLTNPAYGCGLSSSKIGSMTLWENYCGAYGIWLSPILDSQEQASQFLDRLQQATNTAFFFSEGLLKAVPYCDTALTANGYTYSPDTTAIYALTDDDFILDGSGDPVIVTRSNPADAYNSVSVQFGNRANSYNTQPAQASDQASIDQYGINPADPVTLNEIADPNVAQTIAQLILQLGLYIRNTYAFTLGFKYCLLEPMDVVTLTESTGTGLNNVPVQITSIEEDQNGNLKMTAQDYLGGIAHSVQYPSQQPGGYSSNYLVAPGSVSSPVIFDAPGCMAKTGYEIWIAASGEQSNTWGGCYIWASTDGVTYDQVGVQHGGARYGVLSAAFAANTSDPDTTDTCSVDLTVSVGSLTGGTQNDADLYNTLCYTDGELFSYQSATLTAANKYNLGTYLRRSVYGTSKSAHAAGKSFVRIDGTIQRYAYDPAMIGKNIWIKFQSFNVYGGADEGLAGLPAYTYTIQGPIGAPPDVTGAVVNATSQGSLMSWQPCPTPHLAEYEVREGTVWSTATYVGRSRTTNMILPPVPLGTSTWLVKALDTSGNYSIDACSAVLTVTAPSAPTVEPQVIDNNVLLQWTASVGSQPVITYEIRKGATFSGATVIGKKSGLFTTIIETASGVFTYWVVAIDSGGNYGAPGSTTCTVNAPPNYVLKLNVNSTFSGTLTNAVVDGNTAENTLGVVMPVNATETFAGHFTTHSWATPGAQVTAGYPIYIEPDALGSGSYVEFIDYGTTLASSSITATYNGTIVDGSPTVSCDILTSPDNTTWTTYTGVTSVYVTSFRYVKVRINVSGGATAIYKLTQLNIRLDIKQKSDGGSVTWSGNPATVTFNVPFIDVSSINLTVMGQSSVPIIAITDFVGVPNPTTFKIYLFNSTTGASPTGPLTVAWSCEGN